MRPQERVTARGTLFLRLLACMSAPIARDTPGWITIFRYRKHRTIQGEEWCRTLRNPPQKIRRPCITCVAGCSCKASIVHLSEETGGNSRGGSTSKLSREVKNVKECMRVVSALLRRTRTQKVMFRVLNSTWTILHMHDCTSLCIADVLSLASWIVVTSKSTQFISIVLYLLYTMPSWPSYSTYKPRGERRTQNIISYTPIQL